MKFNEEGEFFAIQNGKSDASEYFFAQLHSQRSIG